MSADEGVIDLISESEGGDEVTIEPETLEETIPQVALGPVRIRDVLSARENSGVLWRA